MMPRAWVWLHPQLFCWLTGWSFITSKLMKAETVSETLDHNIFIRPQKIKVLQIHINFRIFDIFIENLYGPNFGGQLTPNAVLLILFYILVTFRAVHIVSWLKFFKITFLSSTTKYFYWGGGGFCGPKYVFLLHNLYYTLKYILWN
jgi:hypothetical protein